MFPYCLKKYHQIQSVFQNINKLKKQIMNQLPKVLYIIFAVTLKILIEI